MIEGVLNRWRGTGTIFSISKFRVIGNIIYALYLGLMVGFLSYFLNITIFEFSCVVSSLIIWFSTIALYIFGESFAWGKWIGHITDYDKLHKPDYDNDDGRSFPYIHYIANAIVNQEKNYTRYCEVALFLRGLVWWSPLYVMFYLLGFISGLETVIISILLGLGFPIAGYIGNRIKIEYKSRFLNLSRGWENQEVVYGVFQGVALWYVILTNILR